VTRRAQADKVYRTVLERYPYSAKIIKCYARFLEFVKNDPWCGRPLRRSRKVSPALSAPTAQPPTAQPPLASLCAPSALDACAVATIPRPAPLARRNRTPGPGGRRASKFYNEAEKLEAEREEEQAAMEMEGYELDADGRQPNKVRRRAVAVARRDPGSLPCPGASPGMCMLTAMRLALPCRWTSA
jgi:hypothetical protein